MQGPGADVVDSADALAAGRAGRAGRVLGGIAVAVLVAGLVVGRPDPPDDALQIRLVEHSGSVLAGQQYVRLWFSLDPSGGDAELEEVAVVLGGERATATVPPLRSRGGELRVLVDVVPPCPGALQALPAGRLEVVYRNGGDARTASLPLPVEGSLPRLVQRRCADEDRV